MSGRDDLLHGTLAKTWGGHAPPESNPMPWKSTLHPYNGVRSVSGPWRIAKKRRPRSYGRGLRCAPSLSGSPVSYPEGATPAPDYTSSRNLITKVLDFVQFGGPKPIPRWDVHFRILKTTERTQRLVISPLVTNRVGTDSAVLGYVHFTLALV